MRFNPRIRVQNCSIDFTGNPGATLIAILSLAVCFYWAAPLAAETAKATVAPAAVTVAPRYSSASSPRIERAINLLSANTTRKNNLLAVIDHRNREPAGDAPFHDLFGFDGGGLKVGVGLRYGLLEDLDLGFYRLNGTVEVFDVYDLDFRYQFLKQEKHTLDMAIRPGMSLFIHQDADNAAGGFVQLLGNRTFKDRYRLGSGLLYHSDSTNDAKTNKDDDHSIAAQIFFEGLITQSLAWTVEMSANLAGYGAPNPQVSTALKIRTYKHTFSIVLSNNQYTSADGVVSGTRRGTEDIILGFTITREIPIGNQW